MVFHLVNALEQKETGLTCGAKMDDVKLQGIDPGNKDNRLNEIEVQARNMRAPVFLV